jgi:Methyltransferase domain
MERTLEQIARWRDLRTEPWPYEATEEYEERIHALLGARWPCDERHGFDDVWNATLDDLATRGIQVGRGAYGGWDDGDARLSQVAWCLVRHLRPKRIVETGVARGLTTRVLLEALEQNGSGHLCSIDLPPLIEANLEQETAAAVPERLYDRWTLLRGSSRRMLRGLLAGLGQIDLFLHDSMHTTRNVRFEIGQVWPALADGGAALIDDVERNTATGRFLREHPLDRGVVFDSGDGEALIGCLVKQG